MESLAAPILTALMLNPLLTRTTLGIHVNVQTHSRMHTHLEELRIPESGELGTEANITPLGNKDRPRVQKE